MKNKPYPLYSLPKIRDLKDMVKKRAENTPDEVAFSFSIRKNKIINKTCREFNDEINDLGTFLFEKGFRNSHIAIIGENSYEWLVAFLAIVNGGNVAVPIDKELPAENVKQLLCQSDCKAVFVSRSYADLVENIDDITVFSMSDFPEYVSSGKELIDSMKNEFIDYNICIDDLAAIVFTSGTTGISKGVMLSQKNIVADINNGCCNFILEGNVMAVLPFHHLFGLVVGVLMVFNYCHLIFITSSLKHIKRDLQIAKPQTLFIVPLFIENFYKQIFETAKNENKESVLRASIKVSNLLLTLGIDIRSKLFSSVTDSFGGNLSYIICGGAPLNPHYVKLFRSFGIEILNAYGITECSPGVAVNRNFHHKDDSVGLPIPNCKVKISNDNEILVKGDNVMLGYYNDDTATNEAIIEGWYYTGDLGYIDDDGFLFITGRKKNLIILSNGENISPEELEKQILVDDAVIEAIVYDENGLIAAEIYPIEDYSDNYDYFNLLINKLNRKQPVFKQIGKIKLRKTEFPKNSSRKILRYNITEE